MTLEAEESADKGDEEDNANAFYPYPESSGRERKRRHRPRQPPELITKILAQKKVSPRGSRGTVESLKASPCDPEKLPFPLSPACSRERKLFKAKWSSSSRFPKWGAPDCFFLPVPEDTFLEDMVTEHPCYQSNAQQKPKHYWTSAAAKIPPYRGPFLGTLLGWNKDTE